MLTTPLFGLLVTVAPAQEAASGRLPPTIENAKLADEELVTLADKNDDWIFEEKLACRSRGAKELWEGTLVDPSLGAPVRKEFQTIGVGTESDSILYFEFAGDVPPAWRKQLNEKLFSATGEPVFAQPELVGQSGKLLVVLSCSLTSKIRKPLGHRLRTRFGMRFSDQDPAHRKLYEPLQAALQRANAAEKIKPDPAGLAFVKAHAAELAPLSFGAFLEARLHAESEAHELAATAYARALALDAKGDPLPSDGSACDALEGIGMAAYYLKQWPEAIARLRSATDYAASIGRADRQATALYNLACSAALGEQPDAAMAALQELIALSGRKWKSQLRQDDDLKSLREREDFKALVK